MHSATRTAIEANTITLKKEMEWLRMLICFRAYEWRKKMHQFVQQNGTSNTSTDPETLPLFEQVKHLNASNVIDPELPEEGESPYGDFLRHYQFNVAERAAIILSVLPHLLPGAIDECFSKGYYFEETPIEAGCRNAASGYLFPTGNTLLFLLAGPDLELRIKLTYLFEQEHPFHRYRFISLGDVPNGEPRMNGFLIASTEMIDMLSIGYVRPHEFNSDFPAKRIHTEMDWDDLVLSSITRRQVEEVKIWLKHRERLMDELGMRKRLKPGNKILFYGPPGTGKTLTAQLLGKFIQKDVFRIDLSMVVNKYVGETEKNLGKIFDKAEHSNWILFFDEADALFGARTKTSSSNDRYANQEVSYLLQRIEEYNGIVILASNMKGNIDDAFMRRFNGVVHFPFPKADERQQLWRKAFPEKIILMDDIDLRKVAEKYEMSGGQITNIAAWCSLMALEREDFQVSDGLLREGLSRELAKEGRTL